MIDLGRPLTDGRWPAVYADVTSGNGLLRSFPDHLELSSGSDGEPELELAIVEQVTGDPTGVLSLRAHLRSSVEVADAIPVGLVEVVGRTSALADIDEAPAVSPWRPGSQAVDEIAVAGLEMTHHGARLVEQELLGPTSTASLVTVELVVGAWARRPAMDTSVTVSRDLLASLAESVGAAELRLDELYRIVGAVVADLGRTGIVVEHRPGAEGEAALTDEVVHRLVEHGGVRAVDGPPVTKAPTSARWERGPDGDITFDLRRPATAMARRVVRSDLASLVRDVADDERNRLVSRHRSLPLRQTHAISVWAGSVPPDVGEIVGEVRHPRGSRLVAEPFRFDGTGRQHLLMLGHTHLGRSGDARWTAQLVPGEAMRRAGWTEVRIREGSLDVSTLVRLTVDLGRFDVSTTTVTVEPEVMEVATHWRATLRFDAERRSSTDWATGPGPRTLVGPPGVGPDAVEVGVEVARSSGDPSPDERVWVVREEAAGGAHVRVGGAHLRTRTPELTIRLTASADDVVHVIAHLREAGGREAIIELRPGDPPKRFARSDGTVFDGAPAIELTQEWLLVPSRAVTVGPGPVDGSELVLVPPDV